MNIPVALELEDRSFKAQMRSANRSGAEFALLRGDSELEKGIVVLKNMADGSQIEIDRNSVLDFLNKN